MAKTKLDKILEKIGEDGNLAPYFEELMNTTLIIPLDPEGGPEEGEEDEEGSVDPFILENDGMQFIPVFDTVERFEAWAEGFGEELSSIEVIGEEFINAIELQDDLHIVVNHLTDYEEIIYPENIQWMQEASDDNE